MKMQKLSHPNSNVSILTPSFSHNSLAFSVNPDFEKKNITADPNSFLTFL